MKKLQVFVCTIAIGLIGFGANAQIKMPAASPKAEIEQDFGMGEIEIEYSRPAANGRKIMGELVPFGKVWRTGANATTTIKFDEVVNIQGQEVKPGTYALYTIPHEEAWEIMLYSDLKLGGSVNDYDKKNEVARFKAEVQTLPVHIESFTINIGAVKPTSAKLEMMWENTYVALDMTTEIDEKVMENIKKTLSDKPTGYAYYQAATYYFNNGKDDKQALEWISIATKENPNAFWMMLTKAKIEYKLGDKKAGEASARETISLAKKAKSTDYIKLAEDLIKENK